MTTIDRVAAFVKRQGKRGTIRPHLHHLAVRVPLWRVRRVRDALELLRPFSVAIDVAPMSLADHFTRWRVALVMP